MAKKTTTQTRARGRRAAHHDFDPRRVLTGLPALAFAFNDEPSGDGAGAPAPALAAEPPGEGGGEQMLPQSRVSVIVQERLDRERRASQERLARLGFSSFEELEAAHTERAREAEAERQRAQEAEAERLRTAGRLDEAVEHERRLAAEREQALTADLEAERTARVELEQTTRRTRERNALVEAANASGAVNVDQVAQLLSGRVTSGDDGRVYVLDAQGQRMTDGAGTDLGVETFVRSWVAQNPHFQPAARGQGAGSRGGGSPPPEPIDKTKLSDISYTRKHRDALVERERNKST